MRVLVLRRFAAFALVLSILPAAAASVAVLFHTNSNASLARLALEADPLFAISRSGRAVAASLCWSALLAAASAWAFRDRGVIAFVRVVRMVAALWLAMLVAYPGFGSWIPILRALPWAGGVALAAAALLALHLLPRARVGWREAAVTTGLVVAFMVNPSSDAAAPTSRRALSERDVLVLGWDGVSYDEVGGVVRDFAPTSGTKAVYANAWTPVAMTGIAWRTILSGEYPGADQVLPGAAWPAPSAPWLPRELAARGYHPALYQDNPATNTFRPDEHLTVLALQGWRSIFNEFAWKLAFPISTGGAPWWVAAFGGPADEPGRYGYDPRRIWNRIFEGIAEQAARGPVFWASHVCYAHSPVHLTLREALRVPRFWRLSPRELEGSGDPFSADAASGGSAIREARLESIRAQIGWVLRRLDDAGVLGAATVFVLSDHGERGDAIPLSRQNHVLLARFAPGARDDVLVTVPVSLADVAPTIRVALGIPSPSSGGVPLPASDREGAADREIPVAAAPTATSLGIEVARVDPASMRRAVALHDDGSFLLDVRKLRVAEPWFAPGAATR